MPITEQDTANLIAKQKKDLEDRITGLQVDIATKTAQLAGAKELLAALDNAATKFPAPEPVAEEALDAPPQNP